MAKNGLGFSVMTVVSVPLTPQSFLLPVSKRFLMYLKINHIWQIHSSKVYPKQVRLEFHMSLLKYRLLLSSCMHTASPF